MAHKFVYFESFDSGLPQVPQSFDSVVSQASQSFSTFEQTQLSSVGGATKFWLSGVTSTAESPQNANNSAKMRKNQNGPRIALMGPEGAV